MSAREQRIQAPVSFSPWQLSSNVIYSKQWIAVSSQITFFLCFLLPEAFAWRLSGIGFLSLLCIKLVDLQECSLPSLIVSCVANFRVSASPPMRGVNLSMLSSLIHALKGGLAGGLLYMSLPPSPHSTCALCVCCNHSQFLCIELVWLGGFPSSMSRQHYESYWTLCTSSTSNTGEQRGFVIVCAFDNCDTNAEGCCDHLSPRY